MDAFAAVFEYMWYSAVWYGDCRRVSLLLPTSASVMQQYHASFLFLSYSRVRRIPSSESRCLRWEVEAGRAESSRSFPHGQSEPLLASLQRIDNIREDYTYIHIYLTNGDPSSEVGTLSLVMKAPYLTLHH
jgi:hypothetical protein